MSPSEAIKMSSPWDKKTFLVSPGRFANPKNLSVMGGGSGTGGGVFMASLVSVTPVPLGFSILATDPATKIFRPLPSYLISSLWLSKFRSSVGSRRGSTTGTIFPEGERRIAGLPVDATSAVVATCFDEEGQNS